MWAGRLVAACIEPAGLTVERIARVPYLCLGDTLGSRMYELDDAVLVCRATTPADTAGASGAGGGAQGAAPKVAAGGGGQGGGAQSSASL